MKQNLKTDREIAQMRKAGLLTWQAHQAAIPLLKPGVTTGEINAAIEAFILKQNAIPLFKGVPSATGDVPFPAVACISVNEELVHGLPGSRQLKEGDVVSIDIGVKYEGWCGDAAVTHPIGQINPRAQQLLDITEGALALAIDLIPKRKRWSQVAQEMERYVKNAGFAVVEGLVGHSIGRSMWEEPQVPNYYMPHFEALGDFELKPGVVIAIEPMVNTRSKRIEMLDDHWTIVAQDRQPTAHFEHTVAITRKGIQILTAGPDGKAWAVHNGLSG